MQAPLAVYHQITEKDIRRYLPVRKRETHKGDYGKVLLLCGSTGFTGAARLAAKAAMRTGSGLVYLGVPEAVYPIVAAGVEEPVVFPLPCDAGGRFSAAATSEILERISQMDAVLVGPGLGRSEALTQLLCELVQHCGVPLVLDADGINGLRQHKHVWKDHACPMVLTPHDGEFARIYSGPRAERREEASILARELNAVVLRKGHRTLITDGRKVYRNSTGNPGMAKGGSGDVLSGILVSLLGQGVPPLEAAALAAWIHGAAGDLFAATLGEYGMLPSDMIDAIPMILK